jgi:phage terminase large subunit-like protein
VAPRPGQPAKSLEQLVREGTFRVDRHKVLLAGDDLQWKSLANLQERFRAADNDVERHRVAKEFASAIPRLHAQQARSRKSLDEVLDKLGPPQSADRVVNFFPRFFRHYAGPKAGKPFRLEPFQERFVREFWRRHPDGRRVYNFGLLGIPKGNGKTPLAAVLGTYALMDPPDLDTPEVFGIAGARKQASFAQKFVKKAIDTGDLANFLKASGNTITCPERGDGTYELLSAEGELAHGVNPSASIVDELWQFRHFSQREGFNALAEALQKRSGESWLIAISQAYYHFDSILGEYHQGALKHPDVRTERDGCLTILEDEDAQFLMHWYGAPDDADVTSDKVLRACNPLSVLDLRDLHASRRRPGANEWDWRRLHANQPTVGEFSWLPPGPGGVCSDDVQVPVGAGIFVAIDAAYSGDCTAVVRLARTRRQDPHCARSVWSTHARSTPRTSTSTSRRSTTRSSSSRTSTSSRRSTGSARSCSTRSTSRTRPAPRAAGFTIAPLYPQSGDMSDAVRAMKKASTRGQRRTRRRQGARQRTSRRRAKKVYAARRSSTRSTSRTAARRSTPHGRVMAHWRATIATARSSSAASTSTRCPTTTTTWRRRVRGRCRVNAPRWLGRIFYALRGKRLVRLHCLHGAPGSTAEITLEGVLVGRWCGMYVLLRPKLLESAESTISFDDAETVEIPAERVFFVEVLARSPLT